MTGEQRQKIREALDALADLMNEAGGRFEIDIEIIEIQRIAERYSKFLHRLKTRRVLYEDID